MPEYISHPSSNVELTPTLKGAANAYDDDELTFMSLDNDLLPPPRIANSHLAGFSDDPEPTGRDVVSLELPSERGSAPPEEFEFLVIDARVGAGEWVRLHYGSPGEVALNIRTLLGTSPLSSLDVVVAYYRGHTPPQFHDLD